MTTPQPNQPASEDADQALPLRPAQSLGWVPPERPPTPPTATSTSGASASNPRPGTMERLLPIGTVAAGGLAMAAALGWVVERRRRRLLEAEHDSVLWADVQPAGAVPTTSGRLDDILPDSPDPAESARAIYVTAIGETNSRREATLIDLHQLHGKLMRRREKGDVMAAVLLLQQHLVDFRYTSPWAFLELRELYKQLERHNEWEIAREAFRDRFGQNAPTWTAPSTAGAELAGDRQLCGELVRKWPYREARLFILRWMLGEPDARRLSSGPPQLGLGIYRDMMLLDTVLDEVMLTQPAPR